jgi:membrane-bound lytic murein transglycosylase D
MTRGFVFGALLCAAALATGCAHGNGSKRAGQPPSPSAIDPTTRLIAQADAHLTAGVAEAKLGHLTRARDLFDRATEVYLSAPGGAFATPRLGDAYRRTLETIQLHELDVLAAGDGFKETESERAAIDDVGDLPLDGAFPTEDARRLAEAALQGETTDVTIELNDEVLACIDLYQGPLRDWFAAALERGGRYLPRIREVFKEEGVPQDLAYLALVESAFKTSALSRAKAKGVWQFMPATGRRFGLEQDWWVDERSNPEKSTRAAAQYLKLLHGLFGDWNLAMAAYNAGEGRVSRSLDRTGAEDFWSLARTSVLARETRNYVPMIHAAIVVAKAPDKYGFEITPEPVLTYEKVPVREAVDLRVIAECLGTGVDDVRLLNPELRRLATPANRTFEVKVPKGSADPLQQCLRTLPPEKRVSFRTHVVARGQTLSSVARMYGARAADIAAANSLGSAKRLARGTELIIPVSPRAAQTVRTASVSGTESAQATPADLPARKTRVSYRIKAGDTLASIAARFRTTVRDLMAWNKLRGTRLHAGNTLTIHTRPQF